MAQARNPLVSGSALAGGRGTRVGDLPAGLRPDEEADMGVDLLSDAVGDLEAATALLARSGQRAAGEVAPYGGRGAGGLFFPRDPDWVPRRAYTKKTPLTAEDVPLPVTRGGQRPRIMDPEAGGITGRMAERRLAGEVGWRARCRLLRGRRPPTTTSTWRRRRSYRLVVCGLRRG